MDRYDYTTPLNANLNQQPNNAHAPQVVPTVVTGYIVYQLCRRYPKAMWVVAGFMWLSAILFGIGLIVVMYLDSRHLIHW